MLDKHTNKKDLDSESRYRLLTYLGIEMTNGNRHWGEIYYDDDNYNYLVLDREDGIIIGIFKEAAIAGFLFRY